MAVVLTNKDVVTFASRSELEKMMQQVLNAYGKVSLCFVLVRLIEEAQLAVKRDFQKMCSGAGVPHAYRRFALRPHTSIIEIDLCLMHTLLLLNIQMPIVSQ